MKDKNTRKAARGINRRNILLSAGGIACAAAADTFKKAHGVNAASSSGQSGFHLDADHMNRLAWRVHEGKGKSASRSFSTRKNRPARKDHPSQPFFFYTTFHLGPVRVCIPIMSATKKEGSFDEFYYVSRAAVKCRSMARACR